MVVVVVVELVELVELVLVVEVELLEEELLELLEEELELGVELLDVVTATQILSKGFQGAPPSTHSNPAAQTVPGSLGPHIVFL